MVGDALRQRHEIVVVVTEGRRAGQNPDVGHGLQFGKNLLRPLVAGQAVDHRTGVEAQRAADFGIFIHQNDAGTGFCRGKRRRQAGDAGAGHQHVAMGITAGIMIRIRLARRFSETSGAADQRFVNLMPGGLRPHEGLIIKARCEHRREKIVDGAQIEGERRETVLRGDDRAVEDFLHRGAHVGLLAQAVAGDVDQRIRFLRPGGQETTRAVIFERAADQMHAIGQQRRRDGIAFQRRIDLAVEGETGGSGRGQPAGTLYTIIAAHCPAPFSAERTVSVSGFGSPAL